MAESTDVAPEFPAADPAPATRPLSPAASAASAALALTTDVTPVSRPARTTAVAAGDR
ncbi:hypothetical protein [Streptomyces sp. NPDC020965]|uniref:hypothetical protein n=1 Tax=Streptomyces sp. NPDC020965 TaxID=3365105 RepID=UPI0037B320BF